MNLMDAELTVSDLFLGGGLIWALIKTYFGQDKKLDVLVAKVEAQEKVIQALRASKSASIERLKAEIEKKELSILKQIEKVEERHDGEFKEIKQELKDLPQRIVSLIKSTK